MKEILNEIVYHVCSMAMALIFVAAIAFIATSCSLLYPDKYFVEGCIEICKDNPGMEMKATVGKRNELLYGCGCTINKQGN